MSQHDFNIANQTFPSFRADLNNALQAAATISAGATAPTTPYAYQLWFDTTTDTWKVRNSGNTAWVSTITTDLATGNVGIGTASPNNQLEIKSDTATVVARLACNAVSGRDWGLASATDGIFGIYDYDAASYRMIIDSSGNVGIGVTPASKLDINIGTDARGYFSNAVGEVGAGNFALQVINSTGSSLKPLGFRAEDIRFATGSSERLRIDSGGHVTMPYQSAFYATTADVTNVTGDYTTYDATGTWTDVYDVNSDFSNGTFTAPVTGKYHFQITLSLIGVSTGHNNAGFSLVASNRTLTIYKAPDVDRNASLGGVTYLLTTEVDMDAGDTFFLRLNVGDGGKTVGFYQTSRFSGHLMF